LLLRLRLGLLELIDGSCIKRGGEGADFGVVDLEKFIGLGGRDDTARFEQNDARGEPAGFAQIVSDEDDRFAKATRDVREFALHLGACDGIEGAEGLVHEQDRRVGGEGARDTDTLTLASRELVGATVGELGWF
jgi:hypothetical protein